MVNAEGNNLGAACRHIVWPPLARRGECREHELDVAQRPARREERPEPARAREALADVNVPHCGELLGERGDVAARRDDADAVPTEADVCVG